MNPSHSPSHETVSSFFDYDQETGNLIWKIKRKKAFAGSRAGHIDSYGYLVVGINGRIYKAHRLVWFLLKKEWPLAQIDHINRIKTDNRIENLRLATPRQNKQNCMISSNNTSGVKGVSWNSKLRKWKASIRVDGVRTHVGYFSTLHDAREELKAARALHHKEFACN